MDSGLVPVFSREMKMEAHFTFTSPQSVGSPVKSPNNGQWKWKEGGTQCLVECGRQGLTMKYETASNNKVSDGQQSFTPVQVSKTHHVARPYERRCKSTAHIVLQQVDDARPKPKLSEFHGQTKHEIRSNRPEIPKAKVLPPSLCSQCVASRNQSPINSSHLHNIVPSCLCMCVHCTTLQTLVKSLSHDCHSCAHQQTNPKPRIASPSISHNPVYPWCGHSKTSVVPDDSCVKPRELTPIPTAADNWKSNEQKEKEKKFKKKVHSSHRPKTIHIDVYCSSSSSSSDEGSIEDHLSSDESVSRYNPPLLALGSKKNHSKNNFQFLPKISSANKVSLTDSCSSQNTTPKLKSKYYRGGTANQESPHRFDKYPATADPDRFFRSDKSYSLLHSSSAFERPASSPPQVGIGMSDVCSSNPKRSPQKSVIALPHPVKPTTLAISPIYSYEKTADAKDLDSCIRKTNSESRRKIRDIYDPCDSTELSSRSDSNLTSLHSAFTQLHLLENENDSALPLWRSPKLERKKYLVKSQESSGYDQKLNADETSALVPGSPNQMESLKTPTKVADLAKLSVFQDFSEEELQVISKSLTKRESERSSSTTSESKMSISRHSSFVVKRKDNMNVQSRSLSKERTESTEVFTNVDHLNSKQGKKEIDFKDEICPSSPKASTLSRSDMIQSKYMRPINVGFFRRYSKFPFNSPTRIGGCSSASRPTVTGSGDAQRQFVRPSMFGSALKSNKKHGLHFGPPRNPQCSCLSCSHWFNRQSLDPRSRSLSDLSPVGSDDVQLINNVL